MSVFRGAAGGGGAGSSELVAAVTGAAGAIIDVTPVLDTNAYAVGDILFDFVELAGALSGAGRLSLLQSIAAIDQADTGVTITFIFADALVDLGAPNAAPSITDPASFSLLGSVAIAAGDWVDLGGSRVAAIRNLGVMLEATAGTSVYMAAMITTGGAAGTFAASNLKLRVGVLFG